MEHEDYQDAWFASRKVMPPLIIHEEDKPITTIFNHKGEELYRKPQRLGFDLTPKMSK